MPPGFSNRGYSVALVVSALLVAGCGTPMRQGYGVPRQYMQSWDSATSACLRNPACYAAQSEGEAILPWVSRSLAAVRTAVAVARLLEAAELARVEQALKDCANEATVRVNDQLLGKGKRPTRELCQETYATDARGNKITWAMHLGREKHRAALECVQRELGDLADNISLQPQYQYDRATGKLKLLDPSQVDAWLRGGIWDMLIGTLIPDVVVHASGDPLRIQHVFDFKFPCPADNPPRWYSYPPNHPYSPANQGDIYKEAFKVAKPARVAPGYGIK